MIGVIDYGASNIQSVCNALINLGQLFELIDKPDSIAKYDKLILPGVGAAGSAMKRLKETGFAEVLPSVSMPVLGLCLGLQLFGDYSEENDTKCLGMIPGRARRFSDALKVPQIGWNKVRISAESPLTTGIPDGSYFYFVHSYYLDAPKEFVIGDAKYGVTFPAVIRKGNFYATQFHPEKSGPVGLALLNNFCRLC